MADRAKLLLLTMLGAFLKSLHKTGVQFLFLCQTQIIHILFYGSRGSYENKRPASALKSEQSQINSYPLANLKWPYRIKYGTDLNGFPNSQTF